MAYVKRVKILTCITVVFVVLALPAEATVKQPILLFDVPFTVQAPNGEWRNHMYASACEEASILMALRWAQSKTLTKKEAHREIAALAAFEEKTYGFSHDTSAKDTARLIRDYYYHDAVTVREDITVNDIIRELEKGNIVIVPVNGQKVKNPYYTRPGPIEHMMVVRGYDPNTRELITNDPGTRRGKGFRYHRDTFEKALQDYPSGFKEPIIKTNKVMIVISKERRK